MSEYERMVAQETLICAAQEAVCVLMEQIGVTRAELARRLDRTPSFVSQILSGERNMTLRTFADAVYALDPGARVDLQIVRSP